MAQLELDDLKKELENWRSKLEGLRVKANLGKMELRDKLEELGNTLEPAYERAKKRIGTLARDGVDEAEAVARSLQAGWDEVRRTHRDYLRETEAERKKR